jgi:hypothetical protein
MAIEDEREHRQALAPGLIVYDADGFPEPPSIHTMRRT